MSVWQIVGIGAVLEVAVWLFAYWWFREASGHYRIIDTNLTVSVVNLAAAAVFTIVRVAR